MKSFRQSTIASSVHFAAAAYLLWLSAIGRMT